MKKVEEFSYGIIPLQRGENGWQILLIKHLGGHWAFPKGKPEKDENPEETALREFIEETGLSVIKFIDPIPVKESYQFRRASHLVYKTVTYFLALVSGKINLQAEELDDYAWVQLAEAKFKITFSEGKKLCAEIEKRLSLLEEGSIPN